jgi:hypothetical protein
MNPHDDRVAQLMGHHDQRELAEIVVRSMEVEQALTEEVSGLVYTTRKQAQIIAGLQGKQTAKRNSDALDRHVMGILRTWKILLAPRASISVEGARADLARKALNVLTVGDPDNPRPIGERRHLCIDAVRGLSLRQYVGPRGRSGDPYPGSQRRHELRYALMDEEHIEDHARFYRSTLARPVDHAWAAFKRAQEIQDRYFWLLMKAESAEEARRRDEQELQAQPSLENASGRHLFAVPDPEQERAA